MKHNLFSQMDYAEKIATMLYDMFDTGHGNVKGRRITVGVTQYLFGTQNWPVEISNDVVKVREMIKMFCRLYKKIWSSKVPVEIIAINFKNNTLDTLLENFYKDNPSNDFKQYITSGIKIGNTYPAIVPI